MEEANQQETSVHPETAVEEASRQDLVKKQLTIEASAKKKGE